MTPTIEQQEIVDAAVAGKNVAVQALAGCAKSSTLYLIAKAMPQKRILYLAFNKAIVEEASGKMPENCVCKTIHSVAYGHTNPDILKKLRGKKPYNPTLATNLGLSFTNVIDQEGEEVQLSPLRLLGWVRKTVLRYMQSSDVVLAKQHVWIDPDYRDMKHIEKVRKDVLFAAKKLWATYINPSDQTAIPHDVYLKIFGLSGKDLGYDVVMVDERQDVSGVMQSILESQRNSQMIYCGDSYQKIYSFTGSVDLKPDATFANLTLSTSFRYGQGIADTAQMVLDKLGCPQKLIGLGKDTIWDHEAKPDVIICRTNATVLAEYIQAKVLWPRLKINITCDTQQILDFANALIELDTKGKTHHHMLRGFKNSDQLYNWLKKTDDDVDIELLKLATLCRKVGVHKISGALDCHTTYPSPDLTITTAHKSKGLEWDCVYLADDFPILLSDEDNSKEELRLFYVATTRAILTIQGFDKYTGNGYFEWVEGETIEMNTPEGKQRAIDVANFFFTD